MSLDRTASLLDTISTQGISTKAPPTTPDDAMDDPDDHDERLEGSPDASGGGDEQSLRRDYLFYLLSEIEAAVGRVLPELSREDTATVGARMEYLAAKVAGRSDTGSR